MAAGSAFQPAQESKPPGVGAPARPATEADGVDPVRTILLQGDEMRVPAHVTLSRSTSAFSASDLPMSVRQGGRDKVLGISIPTVRRQDLVLFHICRLGRTGTPGERIAQLRQRDRIQGK